MTDIHSEPEGLNYKEQLARIDRELATHQRIRQEIRFAPWQVAFAGMTAGAALFAAGAGFATLILKLHV